MIDVGHQQVVNPTIELGGVGKVAVGIPTGREIFRTAPVPHYANKTGIPSVCATIQRARGGHDIGCFLQEVEAGSDIGGAGIIVGIGISVTLTVKPAGLWLKVSVQENALSVRILKKSSVNMQLWRWHGLPAKSSR